MHVKNTLTEYGIISKVLHWLSAILLLIQIPLGFYLVDLDFGEERLSIENIHIIIGLTIFYLVIIRLLNKILNPTPKLDPSIFKGQKFIAKLNHILLYVTILAITVSGALKKLLSGEVLDVFLLNVEIKENFELAELFYDMHIISNYTLITLISLHIFAVVVHKVLFKENLLKRIL